MRSLAILLMIGLTAACAGTPRSSLTETEALNAWLDNEFEVYLEFSPLAKTRLGIKSDYGQLDDASMAAADKRFSWRQKSVARMQRQFDREQLTDEGRRSFDLWVYLLDRETSMRPYRYHRYVFGRRGPHTGLPNSLINSHKVDSVDDMAAYISRLNQSGRYLLQYLEIAQAAAGKGIRAPYFDYDIATSQIERVTRGEPFTRDGTSALWQDVTGKIENLRGLGLLSDGEAAELVSESRQAILSSMKPAYEQIHAWLKTDRANASAQAKGASELPDGEAFYDARLFAMTTLPLSASEIHETGLSEVARIQAEMRAIQERVGFSGTLQDFFVHLRTSDEFYYPNTDAGREAYLAAARSYLTAMQAELPRAFGLLPKGPLEVRRVEAFREQAGGAAHYNRGTRDGSRPGIFYVHLADMRAISKFRMENLAYHEGVPGHHMQIAIQQELDGVPRFRTYHGYTAYSEGWGLYSELLGKELGGYQDPYSDFGRLTGEIWRAIRLVVDTGIHAKGWTEAQAIEYALNNSPRPAAVARSEVRRYFNNPAQATAYKIGMLKIQELRAVAEKALGDQFDLRGFHDTILGSGPLPMPILEAKVGEWIESAANGR